VVFFLLWTFSYPSPPLFFSVPCHTPPPTSFAPIYPIQASCHKKVPMPDLVGLFTPPPPTTMVCHAFRFFLSAGFHESPLFLTVLGVFSVLVSYFLSERASPFCRLLRSLNPLSSSNIFQRALSSFVDPDCKRFRHRAFLFPFSFFGVLFPVINGFSHPSLCF